MPVAAVGSVGVTVGDSGLNPLSPRAAAPLPLTAQHPLPQIASASAAQPVPALGCRQLPACRRSPSADEGRAGVEGEPGYGPQPPHPLSQRVPGEYGCRVRGVAEWGQQAPPSSAWEALISEGLPALHLGGKETPVCLSLPITCLHFFPPFLSCSPFFPFLSLPQKKNKKKK